MTLRSGLGVNYNVDVGVAEPSVDLPFLYGLGFRYVRLLIVTYTDSDDIVVWRSIVQTALNAGFTRVIYGLSFGQGANWNGSNELAYMTALQVEATWAQALGNEALELQVGNEEENHTDGSLTATEVRAFIRSCAASVKTIYTAGTVSYSAQSSQITAWAGDILGNLDRIGFNVYADGPNYASYLAQVDGDFGTAGFVSEFAPDGTNGFADFDDENLFLIATGSCLDIAAASGVREFYFYSYYGTAFGARTGSGDYHYAWPLLVGARRWFQGMPNQGISNRANTTLRAATPSRSATAMRSIYL